METNDVKQFYNTSLKADSSPYEYRRWYATSQARAGYVMTKYAIQRYALPLLKSGQQVFELGPGPGTWTKEMLAHESHVSIDLVDISEEMLAQSRKALMEYENLSFTVSDILEFTPNKQYDIFFSSRMIEYVPDKKVAVQKIVDALKIGAKGFLITKTPHYDRLQAQGKHVAAMHANQIPPEELRRYLEQAGCVVEPVIPVTFVFPKLRLGILDRLIWYIFRTLPFSWGQVFSESYALRFTKQ